MMPPPPASAPRGPVAPEPRGWAVAAALAAVVLLWIAAYRHLEHWARTMVRQGIGLDPDEPLGAALEFFAYEVPKILLLLVAVVFAVGIARSFFTPARARRLLAGRREVASNGLGALLGTVTPFCSCSAVPLFIGFVAAGVPLGATFSFLIAAPMVNEVALVLLAGLFGWRVAALYAGTGLAIAIGVGWMIGRARLERHVEPWVFDVPATDAGLTQAAGWRYRLAAGRDAVRDIVGRVWPFVVGGIAVGAGIHGFVPEDLLAPLLGRESWWAVPAAVATGVPLYANAAGVIPIVLALLDKGVAPGTALAFMMSVVGLSLPEVIILRRVLKPPLIAAFITAVAAGILVVGVVLNQVL